MSNTAEKLDTGLSSQEQPHADEGLITAPLPARVLAAVIDYLVVSALLFGTSQFIGYSDFQFLIPLLCGVLYLGVGNSEVTSGQTLGKRAFGLRVLSAASLQAKKNPYLSLSRSTFRYFTSFGLLLLLAELPPLFYRLSASELPTSLLEIHMLIAMAYFMSCVALAVAHPLHRSFHDLLTPSLVVRGTPQDSSEIAITNVSGKMSILRIGLPLALALLIAFGLWRVGAVHSPAATEVNQLRYSVESRFPFRLLSVTELQDGLEIQALVFDKDKERAKIVANEVGEFLASRLVLPTPSGQTQEMKQLVFSIFSPDDPSMSQQQVIYTLKE